MPSSNLFNGDEATNVQGFILPKKWTCLKKLKNLLVSTEVMHLALPKLDSPKLSRHVDDQKLLTARYFDSRMHEKVREGTSKNT